MKEPCNNNRKTDDHYRFVLFVVRDEHRATSENVTARFVSEVTSGTVPHGQNQKWHVAWAKLDAMRKYPPNSWDQPAVNDYNAILDALEAAAPGEDLSGFRVADDEMKPKPVSVRPGGRSGTPGSVTMGKKRYADTQRMLQRLDAVTSYFINRQPAPETEAPRRIGF